MCTSVRHTREGGASLFAVCQRTHSCRFPSLPKGSTPKASAKVRTFKFTAKYLQQFLKEKMKNKGGEQDTGDGIKERNEEIRKVQRDEGKLC